MSNSNENMRKLEINKDLSKTTLVDGTEGFAIGTHALGLKIPADKLVIGALFKNPKDDVTGATTIALKVGSDSAFSATAVSSLSGLGTYKVVSNPIYTTAETTANLVVAGADLEDGTLEIGFDYV